MKIGILTFHCAHNYGAVLQSYALMHCLQKKNEVEFIDYRSQALINPYKLFPSPKNLLWKNKLNMLIYEILYFPYRYLRYFRFNRFVKKYLKCSGVRYKNAANIDWGKYEVCFYGSDQIWNFDITQNDYTYLGEMGDYKIPKISYAASMGPFRDKDKLIFKKYLNKFDYISVRESTMCQFLQSITDKPINTVLDPTLLLEAKDWDKLAIMPSVKKKYVLIYQIYYDKELRLFAEKIALEHNAIVVELTTSIPLKYQRYRDPIASPETFLGYFKNAECVITTSFHGLAFALLYQKEFFVLNTDSLPNGLNTRTYCLLEKLGLLSRFLKIDEYLKAEPINYSVVNQKIKELRLASINFIEESLNKLQ